MLMKLWVECGCVERGPEASAALGEIARDCRVRESVDKHSPMCEAGNRACGEYRERQGSQSGEHRVLRFSGSQVLGFCFGYNRSLVRYRTRIAGISRNLLQFARFGRVAF
jgi:hypothetical protein